jgi:hypothetical protein
MPKTCTYKIKVHQDKINTIIERVHIHNVDRLKLDSSLNNIKDKVLDLTEMYINNHRLRPTDPSKVHIIDILRETSFVEKIDNYTYRLGIGKTSVLDSKVPYWYVVNYGGIPPDWSAGVFYGIFQDGAPRAGAKGSTWFDHGVNSEQKMYKMIPKSPIPPMHYLNYMAQEFQREIEKFQGRIKK